MKKKKINFKISKQRSKIRQSVFNFCAKESKHSDKLDCYLGLAHLKIPLGSGKPESGRGNSKNNPFGQKGLVICFFSAEVKNSGDQFFQDSGVVEFISQSTKWSQSSNKIHTRNTGDKMIKIVCSYFPY